jgi:hypothetical protein
LVKPGKRDWYETEKIMHNPGAPKWYWYVIFQLIKVRILDGKGLNNTPDPQIRI